MRLGHAAAQRGSATVEAVIVLPAAMVVLLAVLQVGLWALAGESVQQVADQAARSAAALGAGPAYGRQAAWTALAGMDGHLVVDPSVTVTAVRGDAEEVVVVAQAESVVPGWHPTVRARRVAIVQRFRAGSGG